MKIRVTNRTVLKGKGIVEVGQEFDEKDASIVELRRLVAYKKAEEIGMTKIEVKDEQVKVTADDLKQAVKKPMTTTNAGALKA